MSNFSIGQVTEEHVRVLFQQALTTEDRLRMLKGFKLGLSSNPRSKKLYFSAACKCGTAALFSVEVPNDKTLDEVKEVFPVLLEKLRGQANVFYNMSCETHTRMRRAQFTSTGSSEQT